MIPRAHQWEIWFHYNRMTGKPQTLHWDRNLVYSRSLHSRVVSHARTHQSHSSDYESKVQICLIKLYITNLHAQLVSGMHCLRMNTQQLDHTYPLIVIVLTFHPGKLHSVVYSISVPCRASERAAEGPLQDKESFLHWISPNTSLQMTTMWCEYSYIMQYTSHDVLMHSSIAICWRFSQGKYQWENSQVFVVH